MRFEVPQFIEVEDKIVGPLTWKQFAYLAGGAGAAIISFVALPFFLFVIIGVPVVALAGVLAFHQINKRPFSVFLESFIQYTTNTKLYLWHRHKTQVIRGAAQDEGTAPEVNQTPSVSSGKQDRLHSLSRKLTLDSLEEEEPLKEKSKEVEYNKYKKEHHG